jgi:hypothetical protein
MPPTASHGHVTLLFFFGRDHWRSMGSRWESMGTGARRTGAARCEQAADAGVGARGGRLMAQRRARQDPSIRGRGMLSATNERWGCMAGTRMCLIITCFRRMTGMCDGARGQLYSRCL